MPDVRLSLDGVSWHDPNSSFICSFLNLRRVYFCPLEGMYLTKVFNVLAISCSLVSVNMLLL